jgi:hypothetical protein
MRLRQQFPQNYPSSANITAEFENIVRYLNAAELGNKTLGELLAQIFNEQGEWDGPIELRLDNSGGLQYRVGLWANAEDGWETLAALSDLRGPAGANVGTLGAPIFQQRIDVTATAAQTVFDYSHTADDNVIVWKNGLLQRPGASFDYQTSPSAGSLGVGAVTFNAGLLNGDKVTICKVRTNAATGYSRSDTLTISSQVVFPFIHDEGSQLLVYKNGILQREGALYDYVSSAATDTITFTAAIPSGNLVTIISINNVAQQAVTGLLTEGRFCDPASGLILWNKIKVDNGAIPQAKVVDLANSLAAARPYVGATPPASPTSGRLWLDTSVSPNRLKFYDGVNWIATSPTSSLPDFAAPQAGLFIRVNGTGTALEFGSPDLSGYLNAAQRGAANGVASLDNAGRLPAGQLPSAISRAVYNTTVSGATANGTYDVRRLFGVKVNLDKLAIRLSGGTATAQLAISGVTIGSTFPISTTPYEVTLGDPGTPTGQTVIDALTSSKMLQIVITAQSSATGLDVALGASLVTS